MATRTRRLAREGADGSDRALGPGLGRGLALGLVLLLAGPAAALPLALDDAAPRPVLVQFERSDADLAEDLRTPHEGTGPARLASFASDGVTATLTLPSAALEAELGPLALPESASDWVLRLDVATGEVLSLSVAFDTPRFLAREGPWRAEVAEGVGAWGFLPSFRACNGPPRCTLVPAEPYDAATGWLLAVGSARVDGLGAVFSRSDVRLSEVPEPGAAALLLLAGLALRTRGRCRASAAALLPLLLGATACGPNVSITDPAEDVVVLGPDLEASVAFEPPLAAGETATALLERGLDAPGDPTSLDLGDELVVSPDGAGAHLPLPELAPGRNRLTVRRLDPDSRVIASAARTVDRGGFHGASGGRFGAGVRYRTLTRPATLEPGAIRLLDVAVWYPTDDPVGEPSLPIERDLLAVLDAPVASGAAALPTLVFSHGNCGWEGQSAYLLADLARAGYLVAAPAHAGNTVIDPGCNEWFGTSFAERLDDVRALLDALADWSAAPGDAFAGLLDPARLGLVGFSAGGLTTIPIAWEDARVAVEVALATPVAAPGFLPLPVPTLLVAGELDTTAPPPITEFFIYAGLVSPRFMATIAQAGHSNFATLCQTPFSDCVPGSEPLALLHERIARVVRGFLGRYLSGDTRWEPLLTPGEGIALQADP